MYLFNLITHLEESGIDVVSANTDGLMCKIPVDKLDTTKTLVKEWGKKAKFELELTKYKSVFISNVNNYFAIKADDSIKAKGLFVTDDITKSPKGEIIQKASIESLLTNKSIADIVNS